MKRYILGFENRASRRLSVTRKLKVTGGCGKLQDELHDLCSSPNIIREITSRRVVLAGIKMHLRTRRNAKIVLFEKCEGKRGVSFGRTVVLGNKIGAVRLRTGCIRLRVVSSGSNK